MTVYTVGRYKVRVRFSPPDENTYHQLLFRHSETILIGGQPDIDLKITQVPDWRESHRARRMFPMCFDKVTAHGVFVDHVVFKGELTNDAKKTTGVFHISADGPAVVSILLQLCVAYRTLLDGGLMLHASGVAKNDRLYLFSGPSGYGKTTIAERLNDGGVPFTKEASCLFIDDALRVRAFSTPFSDDKGTCVNVAPQSVHAISFIEQAVEHSVTPLSIGAAAMAMLANVRSFFTLPFLLERLMATVASISEGVPCAKLRFSKAPSFWGILHEWADNDAKVGCNNEDDRHLRSA